jgi:hypothetical protein
MAQELRKIRYARFCLDMEAMDRLRLPPYKGSTFRGAFGNTFKRLVCVKRDLECATCLIRPQCVYYYVFETPYQGEPARGYTFAPHPFVIEPPEETREVYEPGEKLKVGLVLIGKALDYLAYFIYAFEEMGQRGLGQGRGKATLKQVWAGQRLIYNAGEGRLDAQYPVCEGPPAFPAPEDRLCLRLQTPTRLKEGGRFTDRLDFPLLVRSLLRRSSDLVRFHCGAELGLDYRAWIERAAQVQTVESRLRWQDWERYSHRQGQKMQMGGVVGEVRYAGELGPFLPLLWLGADVHVGKGTGFGLGRYEIA